MAPISPTLPEMTHLGCRLCIAAAETMLISMRGKQQLSSPDRAVTRYSITTSEYPLGNQRAPIKKSLAARTTTAALNLTEGFARNATHVLAEILLTDC
jgi:hypothetical protein